MKWNPKAEARIVAYPVAALVGAASALLLASCAEVIEAERETARVGGGLTALATDTTAASTQVGPPVHLMTDSSREIGTISMELKHGSPSKAHWVAADAAAGRKCRHWGFVRAEVTGTRHWEYSGRSTRRYECCDRRGETAPARERLWTVTCGLPQQDNPLLALLSTGGYTGPWPGDPHSGHFEVKMLNRSHPESIISTEMWMLSRTIGWWRLQAIRVHPDDLSKLDVDAVKDPSLPGIRQIIVSPFLSGPTVVHSGDPDDEDLVTGQILALLPDASRLRCAPQSDG